MPGPTDRKAPCPCGSGKKYKSCCYTRDVASTPAGKARDFRRVEGLLIDSLAAWSCASSFDWLSEGVARLDLGAEDEELMSLHWAAFHARYGALGDQPAASRLLAPDGPGLSSEIRGLCAAELAAWCGLWRIDRVDPGRGMDLTDLLSGERRWVEEAQASRNQEPGGLICGRVVEFGGISMLSGVHGASLPSPADPSGLGELAQLARDVLASHGVPAPTPEALRSEEASRALLGFWEVVIEGIATAADDDDDDDDDEVE